MITVMLRLTPIALLIVAGCSGQMPANQANAAAPTPSEAPAPASAAAKPVTMDEKTDLLDFHLAWPAEVSAIPALEKTIRDPALAHKAELLKTAASDKADREKQGFPFNAYDFSEDYEVAGDTPRLLSLTDTISEYTGGAHPNHGTKALLWDRDGGKTIAFTDLLDGGSAKLDGLFKSAYCAALDKERAKKREGMGGEAGAPDDPFNQCPKWSELALIPKGDAGKPMGTILIHADPYVAGPYVEGDYDVELPVTAAFIAALKSEYRSSFAAQPQ